MGVLVQLSNMTDLEECGVGGCSPHWKRRRLQSVEVCVYVCVRAGRGAPAAWSVITRWLYNVTQSAYQHFRCQLPRAVPLALHPHLPHVRPLQDRRDPNAYTNQPTLCVPPIGQASRPMRKRAALDSQSRLRTRSSTCSGCCARWVIRVRVGKLPK